MPQQTIKNQLSDLEKKLEEKMVSIQSQEIEDEVKKQSKLFGLPYLNLKSFPVDPTALAVLDESDAHMGQLAVITKTGQKLRIAILNPDNSKTKEVLAQLQKRGYTFDLMLVSETSLVAAWRRYSLRGDDQGRSLGIIKIGGGELSGIEKQIEDIGDLKERLASMPVTKILNILIAGALKIGASDIHFEPEEKNIRLRYRLDGVLNNIIQFSTTGYGQLLSRIKLMSGLKINVHDSPQDGRFTIRRENYDIEVRVSILPGNYGENIVMRILDPTTIKQKLEDLGMRQDILEKIKELLNKTTGAILTTGPTGSGKTTTLYAFLKHVNSPDIKIITIEDPIEYHIEGISQTQVDPEAGYTFASGLRSIVRQDPDSILVGEIRDAETAEIAMQAALTGHSVFSTLHTNNAAGAIPRLIDFGVTPITIAPAVNAVMAQRLVRRICSKCGIKEKIRNGDHQLIKKVLAQISNNNLQINFDEKTMIFYPNKCDSCNQTGYSGRIGVYELFEIDTEMEKLIQRSPIISDIEEMATKKGMLTLLQDGLLKVLDGKTSIDEVLRVIGQ